MVKVIRSYSIDSEVVRELEIRKIENISGLINDLLKSWLQMEDDKENKQENELKRLLEEKEAETAAIRDKYCLLKKKRENEEEIIKKRIESGDLIILD